MQLNRGNTSRNKQKAPNLETSRVGCFLHPDKRVCPANGIWQNGARRRKFRWRWSTKPQAAQQLRCPKLLLQRKSTKRTR